MFFGTKSNYAKSNAIFEIDFFPSKATQILALKLLKTVDLNVRQSFGEKLVNLLSLDAKILQVKLKVSGTRQWHKSKGGRVVAKLYGYYKPKTKYIYIQNFTSVQGKPVAAKTFLSTLLHEWLHHYDTEKLKLHSIHTKGFYQRLTSLKNRLEL